MGIGCFSRRLSVCGIVLAGALALAIGGPVPAQAQMQMNAASPPSNPNPSAAAISTAKELLALKGGVQMFDNVVNNVIQSPKNTFLPTHPNFAKQMNDVTAQLQTEFAAKKDEIYTGVARAYAQRFTEAELKELLAFYKTPLGRKVLTEEPAAVEAGFKFAQDWSATFSEQVLARFRAEMKKKGVDL